MGDPEELASIAGRKTLGDPSVDADVLAAIIKSSGARGGRIYSLDLSTGIYLSSAVVGRSLSDVSFDARNIRASTQRGGLLERAVASRRHVVSPTPTEWTDARGEVHRYQARMVVPVVRKEARETVVGLVDLDWTAPDISATSMNPTAIDLHAQQLVNAYEARSVRRILESTARFTVDLDLPESGAIDSLMAFVRDSSGLQYVALRQLEEDGSLRCVGSGGFGDALVRNSLSLTNLKRDYPPFDSVVETQEHWVANRLNGPAYEKLRSREELADVKSFVAVPVLTGGRLWGVLSFAAAVEYEYSDLEVYSLRALANLTGVSIEALSQSGSRGDARYEDGRLMQAVLSNEVMVATRHEMYNQLEQIGIARSVLTNILEPVHRAKSERRLNRREMELLYAQAGSLDAAHANLIKSLETVRFVQGDLHSEMEKVLVSGVWTRAAEPFAWRGRQAGVDFIDQQIPPTFAVEGSEDWLRIVFMHLILNSLDAFSRKMVKGRKRILLRIVDGVESEAPRIRYTDNAGGIIPTELRSTAASKVIDNPRQAIFQRFVTSKENGTGLGLASCRAAMDRMNGSIDLVDWRNGITFDLVFRPWSER